jgi:glutathione S-transferase
MILIGQYDSPFVRRVAIALRRYPLPFEHRPWSVWGDADQIALHNPLRRVPTLLLDDGTALLETFVILDALDEQAGPSRALLPANGPLRRDGLRVAALSAGIADKAVTLLYASLKLMAPSQVWTERCTRQIVETFQVLEADRAKRGTPYWLGQSLTHADIAFACAFRFVREAHPGLLDATRLPSLSEQAARCEELREFREIVLPITNKL